MDVKRKHAIQRLTQFFDYSSFDGAHRGPTADKLNRAFRTINSLVDLSSMPDSSSDIPADLQAQLDRKLNKNLGMSNAGKVLYVGPDGDVTTRAASSSGVQSVTGPVVDNTDPANPIVLRDPSKQDALTSAQLSAANSGITADKVAKYDGYETSKVNVTDYNQAMAGKQDKLTPAQIAVIDANPYTTAEKDKLANIESGAQANVTPTWGMVEGKPFSTLFSQDFVSADDELRLRTGSGSLIPSQTTTDNQLADKAFVNSSIQNMASNYVVPTAGNPGDPFPTLASLLSGPYYYNGAPYTPTQNDYAIVVDDETHNDYTARYVYSGGQWNFQYSINDTEFTAGQLATLNSTVTLQDKQKWDGYEGVIEGKQNALDTAQTEAVDSGITSEKVSIYDGYAAQIGGKQNVLNADQMNAANSGITAAKVSQYDGYSTSKADVSYVDSGLDTKVDKQQGIDNAGKILLVGDDGNVTMSDLPQSGVMSVSGSMVDNTDPSNPVVQSDVSKQDKLSQSQVDATNSGITSGKVSVYDGYGAAIDAKQDKLSQSQLDVVNANPYSTEDMDKLGGIAAGAEVNTIESISLNGNNIAPDSSKNVDISIAVPTKTSDLTNDGSISTDNLQYLENLLPGSNITISGSGSSRTISASATALPDKFTSSEQQDPDPIGTTITGKSLSALTGINTQADPKVGDLVIFPNGTEAEITSISGSTYDAVIVQVIPSATWGGITGQLSNQSDLQQALDAKQNKLNTAQSNAVNSGITASKVNTYDGYKALIDGKVSSVKTSTRYDQVYLKTSTGYDDVRDVTPANIAGGVVQRNTRGAVTTIQATVGEEAVRLDQMNTALNAKQDKLTAGTGISISGSTISNTYSLPTASATTLGGIKVGDGLSISNGVLSSTGNEGDSGLVIDTTTGTDTAYIINDSKIPNPIPNGYTFVMIPHVNGSGSVITLSVNGQTPSEMHRISTGNTISGAQMYGYPAGVLRKGTAVQVRWYSGTSWWLIVDKPLVELSNSDNSIQWWHR